MPKYNAGVSFITENDGMNCFMTFILHFFYSRSLLVGRLGVGGANHRLLPNSSRVTTERFGRSRCNVSHPLAQPAGCLHRGILCTTLCKKRTCQVKKKTERQHGDRDAQMAPNALARQAASEDMHLDLIGS